MAPKRPQAPQPPGNTGAPRGKRRESPLDFAGHGVKFLGVSVLSGVLLAGLALPAVGAIGLTAKDTAESFANISDDFKTPPLTQATQIFDAKGGLIAKVYERDRTVLTADQMSTYMRQAQVDIEDARFYEHGAVDLKGVLRAIGKNAESGTASQGASTLTQQYVKNVNVEKAGEDQAAVLEAQRKTLGRKIQELKVAIKLEEDLSKDQILTNYLNITFYGHQAYGVEAASQRYFSKSNKDLTIAEAATLAGMVQNPSSFDPVRYPENTVKRRNVVIDKMVENKHITADQAKEAKAAPLGLKFKDPQNGCITAQAGMGFFCDYVRHVVKQDPAFGKNAADRKKLWDTGGLNIYTTLDPDKQAAAQNAVTKKVNVTDSVSAAATMMEPGSGKILAMAQTRPYGLDPNKNQTVVNLNVDASMGGGNGFQTGSTFKPILAAAALESGMSATQAFPSQNKIDYPQMSTCSGTWKNTDKPKATVKNEQDSEVGPYELKEAMARSVNTYFVQMEQQVGLCSMKQMANKLGITQSAKGDAFQEVPSMVLGTMELSPLTMANVYATFAARGKYCTPIAINKISTVDGKDVAVPQSTCSQAFSENTADNLNTVLLNVTEKGTAASLTLDDGRQIAGKTGTTDEKKAAWFSGYTPSLATSVWLGGPAGGVKMKNITIGGHYFSEVFGADGPGPIWQMAMNQALKGTAKEQLQTVNIPDPVKTDPNAGATPPADPNAQQPGGNPPPAQGGNPPPAQGGNPGGNPPGGANNAGGMIGGGFTFPPGIIGGNGNGGNGNGGKHGGNNG
ncbi:membrane peptidoglycan carboxypeptidase [Kitasatospora sp. MAA19]|uniref:transglycosylase domain-containing protein n=1 Tax=Kitasatospora sp. MAA19 TaxID=3035090 RepID=UPI00247582FE|nr:transglycosylase domain-containing protein [Kitasatospora sp. MAA19]MDH6703395.1 membrane peptidoglycan carboxypeptidase [Kitasatospora sp. MAA19]